MEMRKKIAAVADAFCVVERYASITLFFSMLLLMFVQVFFRYVIHVSLAWSEELLRYLFIAVSFVGATVATRQRKHVEINFIGTLVTIVVKTADGRRRFLLITDVIAQTLCTGFCIYLAHMMYRYASDLARHSQLSVAMEMPMWWLGMVIVVSLALYAFHFFLNLLTTILNLVHFEKEEK